MSLSSFDEARKLIEKVEEQPNKFIFGAKRPISNCVLALITPIPRDGKKGKEYAQAHVYLLDKPGRGKTATFNFLSAGVGAMHSRVDGRPDMMPSDLTGYEDVDRHTGIRTVFLGPLHSNVFFMDEINRTPSKGQAILLGAMEGGNVIMYVTDLDTKRKQAKAFPLYPISKDLSETRMFFIVFATANPIEYEGTYNLSEAQKERFTYSFRMGLPDRESEKRIRARNLVGKQVEEVMDLVTLLEIQDMVKEIELSDQASEYIQRIVENSRPYSQDEEDYGYSVKRYDQNDLVEYVNDYVTNGCSPRRDLHLEAATKAYRFRYGRGDDRVATVDDVKAILPLTMEHVILLQPKSLGDNVTTKKVVERIIDGTIVP